MAIWHFTAEFVLREEVFGVCGAVPDSLAFEQFDAHCWWQKFGISVDSVVPSFNQAFGESVLRGSGMRTWHQGAHSVTVYFDQHQNIEAIAAKADARQSASDFLGAIAEAARCMNCVLYVSSLEIVPPDREKLIDAFTRSAARGFLTDPRKTLTDPLRVEFERVAPRGKEDTSK